jgi:molybdopterin converting factor small subunit
VARAVIKLPVGLAYPDGQRELECHGATVGELIEDCLAREPRLRPRVFREDGKLWVGIFLNNRNVRQMQAMETAVEDGDVLTLMPPIAGG